jgi:hypothetical protein
MEEKVVKPRTRTGGGSIAWGYFLIQEDGSEAFHMVEGATSTEDVKDMIRKEMLQLGANSVFYKNVVKIFAIKAEIKPNLSSKVVVKL